MKNLLYVLIAASILNLLLLVGAIIYFIIFGGTNLALPGLGIIISIDQLLISFLIFVEIVLVISSIILYRSGLNSFIK